MSDLQSRLNQLRDLIAVHPEALEEAAVVGHISKVSAALSRFAAGKGLAVSPEEIDRVFRDRTPSDRAQPLDDEALDKVAGATGSAWCFQTDSSWCATLSTFGVATI